MTSVAAFLVVSIVVVVILLLCIVMVMVVAVKASGALVDVLVKGCRAGERPVRFELRPLVLVGLLRFLED
jgi:hypothetical protein